MTAVVVFQAALGLVQRFSGCLWRSQKPSQPNNPISNNKEQYNMNILILGGSGFIGRRGAKKPRGRPHNGTTAPPVELDLMRLDLDAAQRLLRGQDGVVNCVGVMSRHADVLEQVHHHAPQQLAHLARAAGVRRICTAKGMPFAGVTAQTTKSTCSRCLFTVGRCFKGM